MSRVMLLTPELAALPASGGDLTPAPPPEGRRLATDADHAAAVEAVLADARPGEPVWLFAYGSLIWNPGFDYIERRNARAPGWHRAFRLGWDRWFRGCAARPGLMLVLDRGGACAGVAFRLPDGKEAAILRVLMEREIKFIPHAFPARWMPLRTAEGPLRAIGFAIDRSASAYVGGLAPEAVADVLATAAGQWGSMAEYLRSTVESLEALGIHDARLWRLQEMVAERIEAAHAAAR
jgi:cation transport protein ChaC